jgi:hypothetical protein
VNADLRIPRHFHWIWLGDEPQPARFAQWRQGWLDLHPGWEHTVWSDADRPPLRNEEQYAAAANLAQRADVLRYELILEYGGVYLDCDVECCRNLEPLIGDTSAFAGQEKGRAGVAIGSAIFGAAAGHPWIREIVARLPASFSDEPSQLKQTGAGLITQATAGHPDVTVLPPKYLYPHRFDLSREPGPPSSYPDAYAIHHWADSWFEEPAEVTRAAADINSTIPAGAGILLIPGARLPPIELPRMRHVRRFYSGDGTRWANPADSAEAIAEFDRVRTPDIEWVVLHRWAFWWADEFPEFCAYLESISTQVARRPWIVAYRLAPR